MSLCLVERRSTSSIIFVRYDLSVDSTVQPGLSITSSALMWLLSSLQDFFSVETGGLGGERGWCTSGFFPQRRVRMLWTANFYLGPHRSPFRVRHEDTMKQHP